MILTIRTDKPEAEVGLYHASQRIEYKTWTAHRVLSATILTVISELLQNHQLTFSDLQGIVYYRGPGSFTGLRIGAAVANALSVAETIPIAQANGEHWIREGLAMIMAGETHIAQPYYGSEPLTTKPKK